MKEDSVASRHPTRQESPLQELQQYLYLHGLGEVDVSVLQPGGAALVDEVEVLDEQREEWDDDALPLVGGGLGPGDGRSQGRPVAEEVGRRVHLEKEQWSRG